MGKLLNDRNILIMGVRNKWSIAWGMTQSIIEQGANVILTYHGERELESIQKLIKGYSGISLYPCDVTSDTDMNDLFVSLKRNHGVLDGLVHAIAHAKAEDLRGMYVDTSRDGFHHAMDVSVYSLVTVSKMAEKLMDEKGSIITLTYYGSTKVMPGYNVMGVAKAALEASVRYLSYDLGPNGIRINAISAGPVQTLSAKGIQSFGDILKVVRQKAPLRKNVTLTELGGSAVYLLSDLSAGVTGQIVYVDSGFSTLGI